MEHPMYEVARDIAHMEETGRVRDSVYHPTGEDEDPEVTELVMARYDEKNQDRRIRVMALRNAALEGLLEDHGINVPDDM